MEEQMSRNEQKLAMIMRNAPMGLAEIDESGAIAQLNIAGEVLLQEIRSAKDISGDNMFPLLQRIAPAIGERIKDFPDQAGLILQNEQHSFSFSSGEEMVERHFNFNATKIFTGCIVISFEDITEKCAKEQAMQRAVMDKAVAQGKLEMASDVLHDIGNAVVGFGSYLTRIRRTLEQNNPENLQNLTRFLSGQKEALSTAIGDAKTGAVIDMLSGITQAQKASDEELRKSITEQLNIISHIQEILNIQRQYVAGQATQERVPANLRTILNDCLSMVYASFDKRAIAVSLDIPADLPLIKGDRTKLMQVVLNILKNSIEAIDMSAAEKTISIRLYTQEGQLILEVRDSGIGFDEETAGRLFARGVTTKSSGTGLGLNHCRSIVESHGGTIDLVSEGPGKGATATIRFKI